jgi:integrase
VRAHLLDELEHGRAPHGVQKSMKALRLFLHFYVLRHPDAVDFRALEVADVDAFVDERSRDRDGSPQQTLAGVAKGDLTRALQLLDFLREQHDPLVGEAFSTVPFRQRARIASGAVQLRAQRMLHVVPGPDELLTPEARTQAELAKDCWEIANLTGVRQNPTCGITRLDFTGIPGAFRLAVKDFLRVMLLVTGRSPSYAHTELRRLRGFLQFYELRHPNATTLDELAVADVDAWVAHLRSSLNRLGHQRSDVDVVDGTFVAQRFARFLQRMARPEAPTRPIDRIFVPERLPSCGRRFAHAGVRYIPVSVLSQIDAHIDRFDEQYLPVLVVLRASGWRISDVLNLRWDRCLERGDNGWSLIGDIHKTRVLGHRVPISADVAAVIEVQIRLVRQAFTENENAGHFLFPNPHPARLGLPVSPDVIRAAFQRFVKRCEIVDPSGQLFRLRAHAFRHTKAVELINNGMGMTYVQQWLAHLTPEMTLIYAHLSEDTMRKQWEQAMAQGAVQIRSEGPQLIDPDEVIAGNELELAYIRGNLDATRVETGYCFKPLKMECPFVDIACFSCHNHVTTTDFLPQFRRQEQDLVDQIDLGSAAGRPHWVDKNQKKLRAVQAIIAALEQQRVHGLPKAQREYTPSERVARATKVAV